MDSRSVKEISALTCYSPSRPSSPPACGNMKRSRRKCGTGKSNALTPMNAAPFKKARISAILVGKSGSPDMPEPGDIGNAGEESDASSSSNHQSIGSRECDDDRCIDDIFFKDSVRKKLELLSYMVGMDCSNPAQVLSEVVRVLKEFNSSNATVITASWSPFLVYHN